jgi:hypothetical protein
VRTEAPALSLRALLLGRPLRRPLDDQELTLRFFAVQLGVEVAVSSRFERSEGEPHQHAVSRVDRGGYRSGAGPHVRGCTPGSRLPGRPMT